MRIQELSDDDLVKVLLQQYMLMLSAGGISVGRSMESALVESFILVHELDVDFKESVTMWQVFDEAKTRESYKKKEWIQRLLWLELAYMPHDIFVCYVCRAIRDLYYSRWKNPKKYGGSYQAEYDYFCQICLLLRADKKLKQFDENKVTFSYDDLIFEGRDRLYEKRKADPHFGLP